MLISFSWFCHLRAIYLHNTLGSSFGCYSLHPIPEQHFSVSLIRKRSDATSVDQNLVLSSLQFNSTASLIDGRTQNILDLQTEKGPSIQSKWTQWVAFYVATQKLEPIITFAILRQSQCQNLNKNSDLAAGWDRRGREDFVRGNQNTFNIIDNIVNMFLNILCSEFIFKNSFWDTI